MRLILLSLALISLLILAACQGTPTARPELQPTATTVPVAPTPTSPPLVTAPAEPSPTALPVASQTPAPIETPTPLPPQVILPLGDGRIEYRYPQEGFTLVLGEAWQVADLVGFRAGEPALEAARDRRLDDLFTSELFRQLIAGGVRFYAVHMVDLQEEAKNPASLNIVTSRLKAGESFDDHVASLLRQIRSNFPLVEELDPDSIEIDGHTAVRLHYTAEITNPLGETFGMTVWQFLIPDTERTIILTANVPAEDEPAIGGELEAIVASFRLINP